MIFVKRRPHPKRSRLRDQRVAIGTQRKSDQRPVQVCSEVEQTCRTAAEEPYVTRNAFAGATRCLIVRIEVGGGSQMQLASFYQCLLRPIVLAQWPTP